MYTYPPIKHSMDNALRVIEDKFPGLKVEEPKEPKDIYISNHVWHDTNHAQRYRDRQEEMDRWDY